MKILLPVDGSYFSDAAVNEWILSSWTFRGALRRARSRIK